MPGTAEPPELSRFRRRIAGLGDNDASACQAAMEELFAAAGWVEMILGRDIAGAAADPMHVPAWRPVGGSLHRAALIVDEPEAAVALAVIDAATLNARKRANGGRGSVNFAGRRTVLKFLHAGGARLSLWRAPPAGDGFRASSAAPCRRTGQCAVADGETVAFDTGRESYLFDSAELPIVLLHGEVRLGPAWLAREYDAVSHRLVAASAADGRHSRIQLMLTFLRHSGEPASASFERFTSGGEPFFLRWHAMREWVAADPCRARPRLEAMAVGDAHPEVRGAAAETLRLLDRREAELACRA